MTFLCPLLMAEEIPVPSSEDTDKIINESITPEQPVEKSVEKQRSYRYKKTKIKKPLTKIKKGAKGKKVKSIKKVKTVKKTKKVGAQNEETQSGM
jgi:predicted nucleotidyltransferase